MRRTAPWFALFYIGVAAGVLSGALDTWPGAFRGNPDALRPGAKISLPSL